MSFTITIDANAGSAKAEIAAVETGLVKVTASTDRVKDANGRWVRSSTEGGVAASSAATQATAGMDRVTASTDRAKDATGRWIKITIDGGNAAAAAHGRAASAAAGHSDALERLIHLTEAVFAVHQLEGLIDGYIETRNRIKAVSESQENLNGLMSATFDVAQHTRSSWEDVASTYQRLGTVTKGLGLSQQDVINLTEEMAMAAKVGGATNREAGASMSELTHAFATGTLQGREFRVLMRDTPSLMHELAVASGKTGAEFAEMGKKSQITAAMIVDWFGKAGPSIREKFGQTLPTISEGFQLIKNAAEKFFGEAAVGTGVMGELSSAMKFVADHFETFGKIALGVGEALTALFVIEKIIGLIKALTAAIATNPLGVLLIAITAGVALLRQFGDEINTHEKIWTNVAGQYVTVGDKLRALWSMIKDLGAAILDFVDTAWHRLTAAFGEGINGEGLELSLRSVLTWIAKWVDKVIGLFEFLGDSVVTVFGGIPAIIGEAFVNLGRAIVHDVEWMVNQIIDGVNKLISAKNAIAESMPGEHGPAQVNDAQREAAIAWAARTNAQYHLGGNTAGVGMTAEEVAQRAAGMQAALAAGLHPTAAGVTPAQAPGGYGGTRAANLLNHVDLDFNNPLEGATTTFFDKFVDDWKKDVRGTRVTQDMVGSFLDELDKRSHDEAVKRVSTGSAAGEVSTVGGKADPVAMTDKQKKAVEQYERQLLSFEEKTNPIVEAQLKLAHAQEFFTDAVKNHHLAQSRADLDMENYRKRLADTLDPIGAWTRKQHEATDALRADSAEQDRAAQLVKFREEMTKAGIELTNEQIAVAQREIATAQKRAELMHAEQTAFQTATGAARQYEVQLHALADLLGKGTEHGGINAQQYMQQAEVARAAYLANSDEGKTIPGIQEESWIKAKQAATAAGVAVYSYAHVVDEVRAKQLAAGPEGQTFMGGLEAGWLKLKASAESYGATLAGMLLDDVGKLTDAFVTMANGGKVSFSAMVDSMIQDLERLIVKQAVISLVSSVIGGPALPHAATGGHWTVGGSGGTDSQFVGLMMTPGEHLIAQTPQQHASSSGGGQQQAPIVVPAPVVNNINVLDPSAVTHVLSSREGQRAMINQMRKLTSGMKP